MWCPYFEFSCFNVFYLNFLQMFYRQQSLLYLYSLLMPLENTWVIKIANPRIVISLIMMDLFKVRNKLLTRIYISMLALLLAAFFFIGVFTYYNFKTQNQSYHEKRLSRKETATLSSISYFLKNIDVVNPNNKNIFNLFENKIFAYLI